MKKRVRKQEKEENIYNIPNSLTLLRVLIAFVTIYFVFSGYDLVSIAFLFIVGMLTDLFDGQIARRFNMKTEFGRKFDMIADRFLMLGVAFALVIELAITDVLTQNHALQIFMILSREIIASPFVILALSSKKGIPKVRPIGKLTTVLQAFAFPTIILGIYYPFFNFSMYLALLTGVIGVFSGVTYIMDVLRMGEKK